MKKLLLALLISVAALGAMKIQSPITVSNGSITLRLPLTVSRLNVTVSPVAPSISFISQVGLVATVSGGKPQQNKQGVTWSLPSAGSIINATTTSVIYIPPPQACGTALLSAISKADPSKIALVSITVTQVTPFTVVPAQANLNAAQTQQFIATGGCPAKF